MRSAATAAKAARQGCRAAAVIKDEAPGKNALLFNSTACYLNAPWQEATRPSKVFPT